MEVSKSKQPSNLEIEFIPGRVPTLFLFDENDKPVETIVLENYTYDQLHELIDARLTQASAGGAAPKKDALPATTAATASDAVGNKTNVLDVDPIVNPGLPKGAASIGPHGGIRRRHRRRRRRRRRRQGGGADDQKRQREFAAREVPGEAERKQ